jgi:hypothetical protein
LLLLLLERGLKHAFVIELLVEDDEIAGYDREFREGLFADLHALIESKRVFFLKAWTLSALGVPASHF